MKKVYLLKVYAITIYSLASESLKNADSIPNANTISSVILMCLKTNTSRDPKLASLIVEAIIAHEKKQGINSKNACTELQVKFLSHIFYKDSNFEALKNVKEHDLHIDCMYKSGIASEGLEPIWWKYTRNHAENIRVEDLKELEALGIDLKQRNEKQQQILEADFLPEEISDEVLLYLLAQGVELKRERLAALIMERRFGTFSQKSNPESLDKLVRLAGYPPREQLLSKINNNLLARDLGWPDDERVAANLRYLYLGGGYFDVNKIWHGDLPNKNFPATVAVIEQINKSRKKLIQSSRK
ncbi:hypothetical protein ACO0LM_27450 [Undibacterium sp. Di26W]|uniref:hypothetical protein n=1 Tax=Undibacterium sp. Di26W TaxID=3413035 RepID=UPI003BF372EF